MQLAPRLEQLLRQWQDRRAARPAAVPLPDPADCGTAWGLDLSLPPDPPAPPRPPQRQPTD